MNKSEDVSRLFAMLGEKNIDQYQEIHEKEQTMATQERWPVFQHIKVAAEQVAASQEPVVHSSPVSATHSPLASRTDAQAAPPAENPLQPAPVAKPIQPAPAPTVTTPTAPKPVAPRPFLKFTKPETPPPEQVAPRHEPPAKPDNLGALFKRLEKKPEPVVPAPVPEPQATHVADPAPAQSIRSLFNRLNRR